MRGTALALAIGLTISTSAAAQPATPVVAGDWDAVATLSGARLRMTLHFGAQLTWDSPDQRGFGLPAQWTREGQQLSVSAPTSGFTLIGPISEDGVAFDAILKQGELNLPVHFVRRAAGATAPGPVGPPLAADEHDVQIDGGKALLYGTLKVPSGANSGPAVLMIPGSGPTDRDGNSTLPGVKPATLKLIAEDLARRGYPSLRIDKRGIGASHLAAPSELDLRFGQWVDDAAAWARFLKTQPGVTCVVILGHSEGALVAAMAAQRTPVCGVVEISGSGRSLGDLLRIQYRDNGLNPQEMVQVDGWLTRLEHGQLVPEIPANDPVLRPSVQPFTLSEINLDPAAELKAVKAPILIIHGANDLLVTPDNAKRLAAARPDARLVMVPGMAHMLKLAPLNPARQNAIRADPSIPLAPGLMDAIGQFLVKAKP